MKNLKLEEGRVRTLLPLFIIASVTVFSTAEAAQGDVEGYVLGKLTAIKSGVFTKTCEYSVDYELEGTTNFYAKLFDKSRNFVERRIINQFFYEETVIKGLDCDEEILLKYNRLAEPGKRLHR